MAGMASKIRNHKILFVGITLMVLLLLGMLFLLVKKDLNERMIVGKIEFIEANFDEFVEAAKSLYATDLKCIKAGEYPPVILELAPEEVRISRGRIYFILRRFWVEEDGVFVEMEYPDKKTDDGKSMLIKKNVYRYFDR